MEQGFFILTHTYLLLGEYEVRTAKQVMDRVFSFLLWPKREVRKP